MAHERNLLVWLGAGFATQPGVDINSYESAVLVDSRISCIKYLNQHYSNNRIVVKNATVGESSSKNKQVLTFYNVEDFSALSNVDELYLMFPGLKVQEKVSMNVMSVPTLLNELQISLLSGTLIIDIPDQALGILRDLIKTNLLTKFHTLTILNSNHKLFDTMIKNHELEAMLDEQFFELTDTDESDPDIPYLTFTFCAQKQQNHNLQVELESTKRKLYNIQEQLLEKTLVCDCNQTPYSEVGANLVKKGERIAAQCFQDKNHLARLESILPVLANQNFESVLKFAFCLKISKFFAEEKDFLMAVHFMNTANRYVSANTRGEQLFELVKFAMTLKKWEIAVDFSILGLEQFFQSIGLDAKQYLRAYTEIRAASRKIEQHGHDLLLDYIKANKTNMSNDKSKTTFVEIGTTREDIPGQGSTIQLATLCHELGIQFITVDMDPNNTQLATITMMSESLSGVAINKKGEDYLAEYNGQLDFVFLDAYDFDHGNHSELRQARYEKYLGQRIDEKECHVMHLKCAESLNNILSKDGVICIDDTWRDEQNKWTAKGTLAVPFLLNQGFKIIDERNRAVLLKRC